MMMWHFCVLFCFIDLASSFLVVVRFRNRKIRCCPFSLYLESLMHFMCLSVRLVNSFPLILEVYAKLLSICDGWRVCHLWVWVRVSCLWIIKCDDNVREADWATRGESTKIATRGDKVIERAVQVITFEQLIYSFHLTTQTCKDSVLLLCYYKRDYLKHFTKFIIFNFFRCNQSQLGILHDIDLF